MADLRRFLCTSLQGAEQELMAGRELWTLVPPMVGFSPHDVVSFDPRELSPLFGAEEYEALQKLLLLQRRVAASESGLQAYCQRREAIAERIPTPISWSGIRGLSKPTMEEQAKLKVYTVPLGNLLIGLIEHAEADWALAKEVAEFFTPIGRRYLDMPGFTMLIPETEAVAIPPASTMRRGSRWANRPVGMKIHAVTVTYWQ